MQFGSSFLLAGIYSEDVLPHLKIEYSQYSSCNIVVNSQKVGKS
jgi:hypothetical protein